MALDKQRVSDAARSILAAVEDAFSDASVTLPERRYIHVGDVAHDCQMVTVAMLRLIHGTPGNPVSTPLKCALPRTGEFEVAIIRCHPSDVVPTENELDQMGEALMIDAWVLARGLHAAHTSGTLVDQCDQVVLGNVETLGPQGGMGGVRMTLQVGL